MALYEYIRPRTAGKLDNLPVSELIDELGELKALQAFDREREEAIRAELLSRNVDGGRGRHYELSISASVRWIVNTDALRKGMGEDFVTRWSRPTTATTFRLKARTETDRRIHGC